MDKAIAGNLEGTLNEEFFVGKGDITLVGQNIIGIRTNGTGGAEYREAGGAWKPFTSFAVDTIMTDNVTGAVLVDDNTGNVIVEG